jgi:hypothetical protein
MLVLHEMTALVVVIEFDCTPEIIGAEVGLGAAVGTGVGTAVGAGAGGAVGEAVAGGVDAGPREPGGKGGVSGRSVATLNSSTQRVWSAGEPSPM